jgi:hypothetical protein
VENSHEAIIEPETFELVQEEFRRREKAGRYTSAINCFASRITCGDCGGFYGRKVWHSNTKYAQTIWQCNNKFLRKAKCTTYLETKHTNLDVNNVIIAISKIIFVLSYIIVRDKEDELANVEKYIKEDVYKLNPDVREMSWYKSYFENYS